MLTPEQKACSQQFSDENLEMLRTNAENSFSRIIIGDEKWVHNYDTETKQRVHAMETQGIPYSQEISCATTSQKDHGNSFLNSEGVLLLEFMPHKTIITGDIHASTMVALL